MVNHAITSLFEGVSRSVDDVIAELQLLRQRVSLCFLDLELHLLLVTLVLIVEILLCEHVLAQDKFKHFQ